MPHTEYPRFMTRELPPEDQAGAFDVQTALMQLDHYARRYKSSLELIDRCLSEKKEAKDWNAVSIKGSEDFWAVRERLHNWMSIAERDAVITVWDFSTTVYEIRKLLDRCKGLNELVDRPALERVLKNLSERFPDRKKARHAAAHPADMSKTADERSRHSVSGPMEIPGFLLMTGDAKNIFISAASVNGVVTSTYRGEVIEAPVTWAGYQALVEIRDELYKCFETASKTLEERMRSRLLRRRNTPQS
jgi:hypothetical protein